jgi:serine protease DegQ
MVVRAITTPGTPAFAVFNSLIDRRISMTTSRPGRAKVSAAEKTLAALSDGLAAAVEKAAASTVMVAARRRIPASGILYSASMVLTADHVIEREDDISVTLPDGRQLWAGLAGRDPGSDLALLKLEGEGGSVAETAPGEARVGQLVLALGRPSAGGIQASLGIVSAVGGPLRTGRGGLVERYLTTDAIPYPGFSGGPLVDASGRVLGINTSGLMRGASLAIPAVHAWANAAILAEHGHIRRGYLGLRTQPVELPSDGQELLGRQQASGLLIVGLEQGSPAEQAGLIVGDILTGLAGSPVSDHDELLSRLAGAQVGEPAQIEILRGGKPQTFDVSIGERK